LRLLDSLPEKNRSAMKPSGSPTMFCVVLYFRCLILDGFLGLNDFPDNASNRTQNRPNRAKNSADNQAGANAAGERA
jgi:hypothetical protein